MKGGFWWGKTDSDKKTRSKRGGGGPDMKLYSMDIIREKDLRRFLDLQYKEAIKNAHEHGVEIIPIQVHWNDNGVCFYDKVLPCLF